MEQEKEYLHGRIARNLEQQHQSKKGKKKDLEFVSTYSKNNENSGNIVSRLQDEKGKKKVLELAIHNSKNYKQAVLFVASFGKDKSTIMDSVSYLTPNSETEIKTGSNKTISPEQAKIIASKWVDETKERKGSNRYTMNLILQSLPHADDKKAEKAFSSFLKEEFPNNEYIYSIHKNTDSPHAHVIIKLQNRHGKKIQATKKELYLWRESLAKNLRDQGFLLTATSRLSRGLKGKSFGMGSINKAKFYDKEMLENKPKKTDQENIESWKDYYNNLGDKLIESSDNDLSSIGEELNKYSQKLGLARRKDEKQIENDISLD